MDLTLPKIQPNKLTSTNANETDKARYEQAYAEFSNLNQGYSDLAIQTGDSVEIISSSQVGELSTGSNKQIIDDYIQPPRIQTVSELLASGTAVDSDAEQMEAIARNAMPEYRRSQEVMGEYTKYQNGQQDYDSFLINAYGRDVLKANNYHTDSVVWWKSQFRQGNYQHPLDNVMIKASIIQQAEQLFQLEGFYNSLLSNNTTKLEKLVGKVLDEDGYKTVFGDAWESVLEKLGSFEQAVNFYKAGHLGDAVNQLIYTKYQNDGTPVGDPAYYVGTDGKLYELIEKGKPLDKSYQMYLEKNADGSIDRVTQAANGWGEFWGAFGNGFIGAFTGVVDLVSMAGLSVVAAFASDDIDFHERFTHVLTLGLDQLWVKDDWYISKFVGYQGWVNNNLNQSRLRQQDFDNDKLDHWATILGQATGYITETALEIFLSTLTAGGFSAAKKGAEVTTTNVLKGSIKEFSESVITNLGKFSTEEIAKKGTEVVIKEVIEEVSKLGLKEFGEETLEKIVKGSTDLIIQGAAKEITSELIQEAITDTTVKLVGKEIIEQGFLRGVGLTVKTGTNGLLKASNHLKMLNSGSMPFLTKAFKKILPQKWASTTARASVNFLMTAAEASVKQRVRQKWDSDLTDDLIVRNSLVSGLVVAASTMALSSSTDDYDNMTRLLPSENSENLAAAAAALRRSGVKAHDITVDMMREQLKKSSRESAKNIANTLTKFNAGSFIMTQNFKRIVGGASEFLDNVITTSVRNSANMGVQNLWGDGGLIDFKGAFSNPDTLVSSALSTTMSVVGRRMLNNEGSFNEGVAGAKQDVKNIYSKFEGLLQTLSDVSEGETRNVIDSMLKTMQTTFKEALTKDMLDDVEPYLVVLQKITSEVGTDANANPLSGLDTIVNTLLKTDAGKAAIADDILKDYGITRKTTSVTMSDLIGKTFDTKYVQKNLDFYKGITDRYYLKTKFKREILESPNLGFGIWKTAFGKNLRKAVGFFLSPDRITNKMDRRNYYKGTRDYIEKIAPGFLQGKDLTTENLQVLLGGALAESISKTEEAIRTSEVGLNFDANIKKYQSVMTLEFVHYQNIEEYIVLRKQIIDSKIAKDEADAELKLNESLRSGKKIEELNKEQQNLIEIIKEKAEKISTDKRLLKKTLGLSRAEIIEINKNAAKLVGASAKDVRELTMEHLRNGVVVNFLSNEIPGSDQKDVDSYRKAVTRALKIINKVSGDGGEGPQDFVVLGEGKVFIASPIEIDNLMIVEETLGVLNRIVRNVNHLASNATTLEEKNTALTSMINALKLNPKGFKNIDELMEAQVKKVDDLSRVIATMDLLADKEIGVLNQTDLLRLLKLNPDLAKFNSTIAGGYKSLTWQVYRLDQSMEKIRKITSSKPKTRHKMLELYNTLRYIDNRKDFMEESFADIIGYEKNTFSKLYNELKDLSDRSTNFHQTQEMLEKTLTKLSTQYERDSSQQARMNLIRQWENLTVDNKVEKKLIEILDEESSSASVLLTKLITSSLESPFEEGKTLKEILDAAQSYGLIKLKQDYDDLEEYISLKYLETFRDKRDELAKDIVKRVKGIKSTTHLFAELSDPDTKFNFKKVQKLIDKSTELTKRMTEIIKHGFNDSEQRINELNAKYKELELKKLTNKNLAEVIINAVVDPETSKLNINFNQVDKFLDEYGIEIPIDKIISDHIKKGFTNKDLSEYIPSLRSYLKNKSYSSLEEAINDVKKAYNAKMIYSNLEETIANSMALADELYDKAIPFESSVEKITVNVGELSTNTLDSLFKTLTNISNQKYGELGEKDINNAISQSYGLTYELKTLRDLQKTLRYSPIITFDLSEGQDAIGFNNLMRILGYKEEQLLEAASGKIHKIPGVYFNNDSAVIASGKSNLKYDSLQKLISNEINNISFNILNGIGNNSLIDKQRIISLFPKGIVGISGETRLNVGGAFNPNWSFDSTESVASTMAVNYVEAIKAGKLGNMTKDAAFDQLYRTIGLKFENPENFSNYLIIKGIVDTVNIDNSEGKEYKKTNALDWDIKKYNFNSDKINKLKEFGWILDESDSFVTGIDMNAFNQFLKNSGGVININEILPVQENWTYVKNVGGSSGETFEKRYYEALGVLFNPKNNTDGLINILVPDEDTPFKIPKNISIDTAINMFKSSSNLQEKTFAVALEAAKIAADNYSKFLDRFGFTSEDKDKLLLIGQLVNDENIAEILASNDDNETKVNKIKNRIKIKKNNIDNIDVNELDVKTKSGDIPLSQNIVYANAIDYGNPELMRIEPKDIDLLKRLTSSTYIKDSEDLADIVSFDLKNKFIAMLSYDEDEGFYIPVSNLLKLNTYDFQQEIGSNKLTLGSWIESTFGEDFYEDLLYTTEKYDKLYPNYRTNSYKVQQNRQIVTGDTPNIRMGYRFGLSLDDVEEKAKNFVSNKQRVNERNAMEHDLINASEIESNTQESLRPLIEGVNKGLDDVSLNANTTMARTKVNNLRNKITLTNYLDNLEAVRQELESGRIIPGIKDGRKLAFEIVSLSSMNSGRDIKNSYVYVTIPKTGDPTYETVSSSTGHPFNDLAIKMAKHNQSEDKHYLIKIEDSFSLKKPNEKNFGLSVMTLKGDNKHTSLETQKQFFDALFFDLFNKLDDEQVQSDDICSKILEIAYEDRRISANKKLIIDEINSVWRGKNIPSSVITNAVSLFQERISEMQSSSAANSFTEQAFLSTFSREMEASIFNEKRKNLLMNREQGVLFDHLDMGNLPKEIEEALGIIRESITNDIKSKGQNYYDELMETVHKIKNGDLTGYRRYDHEKISDVIKLFALETNNTAFKKMLLDHAITGKTLNDYSTDRHNESSRKFSIKTYAGKTVSFDELMKSNDVVKVYIDNEWTTDAYENNKFIFEFGYRKSDGTSDSILIKPPKDVYDAVVANLKSSKDKPEWTKFTTWLRKNNKVRDFQNAWTDGIERKNAPAAIIEALKTDNENTIFLSFNGKGKGSDLAIMKENFGDEVYNAIEKTGYGHLDVLNDVIRQVFIDVKEDESAKNTLEYWTQKFLGSSFVETHKASQDAEILELVSRGVTDYILSTNDAKTKVIDYVGEIYEKLSGKNPDKESLMKLSRDLNFNRPIFEDNIRNYLAEWQTESKNITDDFAFAVVSRLNYLDSLRGIQAIETKMFDYMERMNPYDHEKLRDFFYANSDNGTQSLIRSSLNKMYNILSTPKNMGPVNYSPESFAREVSKAIGDFYKGSYGSDETSDYFYTNDSFMDFINDLKESPEGVIDSIVSQIKLNTNRDNEEYISASEYDSIKDIMRKHREDIYSRMEDEINMENFQTEVAQSKFNRSMAKAINELVLKETNDVELQKTIINKLARLLAPTNALKTPEDFKTEFDKYAKSQTFSNELIEKLQDNYVKAFKDSVTNVGIYKMVKAMTDNMLKRLEPKYKGISKHNGIGYMVANKAGIIHFLGTDLATYKREHNIPEDQDVFISMLRHPSDKLNTIHAYRLVEDTSDPDTAAKFSMNALELFSKHSGDFDGDHVTIFVPDDFQQKIYQDGALLDALNKPYYDLQDYMTVVYKNKTVSETMSDKIIVDLDLKLKIQESVASAFYNQSDAVKKLVDALDNGDDSYYNALVKKITDKVNSGKKIKDISGKVVEVTEDDIRRNFITKDTNNEFYYVQNKYMLEKGKDHIKLRLSAAQNALMQTHYAAMFKQSINAQDETTGVAQKDMIRTLEPTEKKQYISIKLTGEDFEAIDIFLSTPEGREYTQKMYGTGPDKEFTGNAFTVYRHILNNQREYRDGTDFNSVYDKVYNSIGIKDEKDYNSIERAVNVINKRHEAYKNLLPKGYTESKFSNNSGLSPKEKEKLLSMFNELEEIKKITQIEKGITSKEMKAKGLTVKIVSLIDLDNAHLKADDSARLTKDFIDNHEIYTIHEYDTDFVKPKKEYTKDSERIKKIKIGSHVIEVYKQKFNTNVKLANSDAGSFGKVTTTDTPIEGDDFKGYAYVLSSSTLGKLDKANAPDVSIKRKPNGELDIKTINGNRYVVVESQMGIAENEHIWNQKPKDYSVDQLTFVMTANTVEVLPLMSGILLEKNSKGEIVFNTEKLKSLYQYRQEVYDKGFFSPNFMSTYNQIRALKAINYGLKHIKDKQILDVLNKYKARYTKSKNFSSNITDVKDIITIVDMNTDNKFSKSLTGMDKKLFSDKLKEKILSGTTSIYDLSPIKQADGTEEYSFYGKGGRKELMDSRLPHQTVPSTLEGDLLTQALGGKLNSKLYLSTYDALNFLLDSEDFISKEDLKRAYVYDLGNIGLGGKPSIGSGFRPFDMNDYRGDDLVGDTEVYQTNIKGGHESGDVMSRQLVDFDGSSYGAVQEVDDIDLYLGTPTAYDKMMKTFNFNSDGLIDPKFLKSSTGADKHTNRHQKFLRHIESLLNDDFNTNDRISHFKNSLVDTINIFANSKRTSLRDGLLTPEYTMKKGTTVSTFKDASNYLYNSQDFSSFGDLQEFKEKRIKELSEGLLDENTIDVFKKKREDNKKLPDISDYKFNKSLIDSKGEFINKASMSKFTDEPINDDAEDTRLFFKKLNSGDTEINHSSYDALDETGRKVKDIQGVAVKQGIGKLYRDSKYYIHEITSPLTEIKRMIGNNQSELNKFERFTQVRKLALGYKDAHDTKDYDALELAKKEMSYLGIKSLDEANEEISHYTEMNPGMTSLYYRTMQNLQDVAYEIASITGGMENISELFLLSPSVKKDKLSDSNKNSYKSSLDTVFLHKEKSLSYMIEMATKHSFADSIFELATKFSKVKAMNDAIEYFKKSGSIENQTIFDLTHSEFEKGLSSLKKDSKGTFVKQKIIESIASPLNELNSKMALNETFYEDVYWQLKNSYAELVDSGGYGDEYHTKTLFDLEQELSIETDVNKKTFLNNLIEEQKNQRIFMVDTIALNDDFANKIYSRLEEAASSKNSVLTNEFMQLLPGESRSHFNFLYGFDFNTLRRNVKYITSGNTEVQRKLYMALSGNLFLSNKDLADHMDKYFFTQKMPGKVEQILSSAKGNFAKFIMSMPHKLINRMTQYSISDMALIGTTDTSALIKYSASSSKELRQFFGSKGASLEPGSNLELFMKTMGFNPFSYEKKSLNLDTMERENSGALGKGYFDSVEKVFTEQTLLGRYILWRSLYDRFKTYDETGVDKRLYGPLYSQKKFIDALDTPEEKAREVVYATIGGPNGFALIARKELNNVGMFMTYPLALLRTGIGHLKSIGSSLGQLFDGTMDKSTGRYLGNLGLGVVGTQLLASLFIGLISSHYGVDEKTEEEWKKKAVYINPFATILNDRPVPLQGGSLGLYAQFREMFYEPFEESNGLIEGGGNWFSANVISRLNPVFKMPLELLTGKDFYGNEGPIDSQANSFADNFSRKMLSTFIGVSGANAMSDQWYYSSLGEKDPRFVNKLGLSLMAAIKAESGNYRGYKILQKNYYNALTMVRGFKTLENSSSIFPTFDNGFDSNQMNKLSSDIKYAMDKEQPASVIYGIIDEAIKEGASSSTIKAALYNNSISGKLSQLDDVETFYNTLDDKSIDILEDALKYEEQHYSILKTLISEYSKSKSGYTKQLYVPKSYYTYPSYSSSKYNNHYQYNNSWFSDDKWTDYAKKYIEYRAKNNFVPSLTELTGKYKKKQPKIYTPKKKNIKGELDTYRFYDEDDNALSTRSRVNEEDR